MKSNNSIKGDALVKMVVEAEIEELKVVANRVADALYNSAPLGTKWRADYHDHKIEVYVFEHGASVILMHHKYGTETIVEYDAPVKWQGAVGGQGLGFSGGV